MNNASTKRRNAIIAGVAGAALLVGGSTYALWSASDTTDGGSITSGNLNIVAGDSAMWDVSPDRTDVALTGVVVNSLSLKDPQGNVLQGHAITDSTWEIVPADKVAVAFPLTLTLEGDNLVAKLTTDLTQVVYDNEFTTLTSDDIKYAIYGSDGMELVAESALPDDPATALGFFQAPNVGQAGGSVDGTIPFVNVAAPSSSTGDIVLVLFVTWPDSTPADLAVDMSKVLTFSNEASFSLEQVRCDEGETAGGNFTCN